MKYSKNLKLLAVLITILSILPFASSSVSAMDQNFGGSYFSYTYDFSGKPVATPAAFEASEYLNGFDFGNMAFKDLSDITRGGENRLYIADSGNNRVLVCDYDLNLIKILTEYDFKGEKSGFNLPACVAALDGKIYVADSQNARIVVFDELTLKTLKVLEKPDIPVLGSYTYIPKKLTVDYSGRIYVIADRINKGLIQLDPDGRFEDFIGAPKVKPSTGEIMMRKFLPRSVWQSAIRNVPTEYHSLNIDQDGFIFVTSKSANIPPVARLNGQGSNVLVRAYESEDEKYMDQSGNYADSMFVDVIPRADGGYFALDATQGRIFSYDKQGLLLYIFGSSGTSKGSFYSAASLEYVNGKIIVLDGSLGTITVFHITEFGEAIATATHFSSLGKVKEERAAWENVLRICSNYDMAEIGLARIEIDEENFSSAMKRMIHINEKDNYGIAFKYERTNQVKKYFMPIAVLLATLVIFIILWFRIFRKTKFIAKVKANAFYRELKFSSYVMFHPFDGFWDLKREKRGSVRAALTLLGMFIFWYAVRTRFSGYQFIETSYKDINVVLSLATILTPILLFVLSSWCFTTLMDGKGTMKDGFIAVCYGLTPYVVLSPLQFILSHLLIADEMVFYTYINAFVLVWVIALFFFGMMMTHDYSFGKSVVTAILSLIGICLILFICLLLFNLYTLIFNYVYDLYRELSFRFY